MEAANSREKDSKRRKGKIISLPSSNGHLHRNSYVAGVTYHRATQIMGNNIVPLDVFADLWKVSGDELANYKKLVISREKVVALSETHMLIPVTDIHLFELIKRSKLASLELRSLLPSGLGLGPSRFRFNVSKRSKGWLFFPLPKIGVSLTKGSYVPTSSDMLEALTTYHSFSGGSYLYPNGSFRVSEKSNVGEDFEIIVSIEDNKARNKPALHLEVVTEVESEILRETPKKKSANENSSIESLAPDSMRAPIYFPSRNDGVTVVNLGKLAAQLKPAQDIKCVRVLIA